MSACPWMPEDLRTRLPLCDSTGPEVKLYRRTKDIRWFAFGPRIGWVMFPAEVAGWKKRQPYDDDLMDMREVPLSRGFNTGIPGAPMSAVPFLVPKRRSLGIRRLNTMSGH